jgi:hypothetical protein
MACTIKPVTSAGLMVVLVRLEKADVFRRGEVLLDPGLPGSGTQHDVG